MPIEKVDKAVYSIEATLEGLTEILPETIGETLMLPDVSRVIPPGGDVTSANEFLCNSSYINTAFC